MSSISGPPADHQVTEKAGVPVVTDDVDAGFLVGDIIIDTVAAPREGYKCTNNAAGAAVWEKTTTAGEAAAPLIHAATHENGGSDEINVDGLSGELADPQPSTIALVSDLDSVGDLVITKVGVPSVNDDSAAGWVVGDQIINTTTGIIYAAEDVSVGAAVWEPITTAASILETSGPTRLVVGTVTDGEVLKRVGATLVSVDVGAFPPGYINDLELLWAAVSDIRFGAGECRDSTDSFNIVNGGTLAPDITSSGANGLDTGAEAADTWYAVHIIDGDVPAVASLLSLSATAPTLPATYTRFRHIGWVRNDSSSNFLEFIMVGPSRERLIEYQNITRVNLRVLNNGSATAMTAVSLSSLVPPTSEKAQMIGLALNTSDDRHWAIAHGDSTLALADQPIRFAMNKDTGGFDTGGTPFAILIDSSQEVVYGVSNANVDLDLFILGYFLVL